MTLDVQYAPQLEVEGGTEAEEGADLVVRQQQQYISNLFVPVLAKRIDTHPLPRLLLADTVVSRTRPTRTT